ncbi:hypothetical protein BJ912DRAFT_398455 [Pholiota molesta]|nr:hypothetical protein BJ912DRAFT_398455 [Pholiota molesta]
MMLIPKIPPTKLPLNMQKTQLLKLKSRLMERNEKFLGRMPVVDNYSKKMNRIRGMLKNVKEMPVDILFEIFSLLNPIDLVNLTRTSKDLRAMLMSRSSISVWKSARANFVPAMPECPDDLSEPQYAELAFGKGCHYCQRNLGTIHTAWTARRRICNKCIDTHCCHLRDISRSEPLYQYLPTMKITRKSTKRYAEVITYYFPEFAKLWRGTYHTITDSKERESWKSTKAKERTAIDNHAQLCTNWLNALHEYQQSIINQFIRKQQNEVAERVAYLGWSDDVAKLDSYEKEFQDLTEVVKICQKVFTDHTLSSLDDKINQYMGSIRQKRLKRERATFLGDRLPILQKVLNDHLLSFPVSARYWYPMASELYLREPQIQEIVNDASSTLESLKEQLALTIPKIYPDAISKLIQRIDDQLLELIARQMPEQVMDRETVFSLATTVFECAECKYVKRILRHSEAVLHSCTRNFNFPEAYEDHEHLARCLKEKYRSHRSGGLTLSKTALELVPILLKLCGLDPGTTTGQMMDDLNPIFECIPCGSRDEGRPTMTWLGAVVHFNSKKHDFGIEEGMKLERLNEDEEDMARKRIIEIQERAQASKDYNNPLIQCAHCFKTGSSESRESMKRHVKSEHGIEKPKEKDLMLNVDTNHIPDIFTCGPLASPRKRTSDFITISARIYVENTFC